MRALSPFGLSTLTSVLGQFTNTSAALSDSSRKAMINLLVAVYASTLFPLGYTVATFLMGLLPGRATWGIAAPILLVVLRILQGIGVGGEWGGSVLLSMEWGSQRRRGFFAS